MRLGREAADWAGVGFAGPGEVWPVPRGLGCWRRRGDRAAAKAGPLGAAGPRKRKAGLGHWVGLVEFGLGF